MEMRPAYGFPKYQVRADGSILRDGAVRRSHRKVSGYYEVALFLNGSRHIRSVHRLVWSSFFGEIPDGYHVNHIDGDKSNNALSNLECVTPAENYAHSKANCVHRGEDVSTSKLNDTSVRDIRRRSKAGEKLSALAVEYGVGVTTVRSVVARRSWTHLPDEV
jgi:hypothetical protein